MRKKYSQKSKNVRAKRWWRERLEIQKTDNLFTTHQLIEGIDFSWADFSFIGKKPDVYAATISTAKYEYAERLFHPAWEISQEVQPFPEGWRLFPDANKGEDLVEGIPRHTWISNKMKELADSGNYPVYEEATIIDYRHAWGLYIVVNKPMLTAEDLNEFIANWDFKPYKSREPLTFKSKELYWGLEARGLNV